MRAPLAAAMLLLLLGLGPSPAAAAPSWLAPVNLSAAGQNASAPQVAVDAAGDAVAVWARFDGSNTIVQSAARPAGLAWEAPVDLSAAGQNASAPQVAIAAGGTATAVWSRFDGASGGSNSIVQASTRPSGGGWSPPVDLSAAGQNADQPQVALDGAGDAVAVWRRYDGADYVVQGSSRPVGQPWGSPLDISAAGEDAEAPQVAIDSAGEATAVWSRFDGSDLIVQSSVEQAGGEWGVAQDLSVPGRDAEEPQLAVDLAGDATAVWRRRFAGSEFIVQSAARPAGGTWGQPVELSTSGQSAEAPQVAADPRGDVVAVWSQGNGGPAGAAQAVSKPAGGAWEAPVPLSAPGGLEGESQVGIDQAGDAVALWTSANATPTVIFTARRPAAGGWGPGGPISVIGSSAREPQLALDGSGDALAVWARNDGSKIIAQAAGFDGAGPQMRGLSIPAAATIDKPAAFAVQPFDIWSAVGPATWSFGDGVTAMGDSITHTFTRQGVYAVSATTADALGNGGGATGTVVVYPKARAGHHALVSRGRARLRVYCPSPAGCEGTARLYALIRSERPGRRALERRRRIGTAPFLIEGAETAAVPVRLSAQGASLAQTAGRKGLKTQLTGPGIKHRVVVLLAPA